MRTLGVIGGLGPMATAFFIRTVIEMTEADTDQEHIEMIVYHCPSIPDRTGYILGNSRANPEKAMADIGKKLAEAGADVIAVPCVTAGCFYKRLSEEIPVPIINAAEETAKHLAEWGVHSVGLMATEGTIQSGLFQIPFRKKGIDIVLPDRNGQKDVTHLIYRNVKAGKPAEKDRFERVSAGLRDKGAQVILLGCTELSVIKRDVEIGAGYLDVAQVIAKRSVEKCGILKKEFRRLITQ